MQQVKKVLVALALSEYSQETFDFAADFARHNNAELIVVNVINSRDVESVQTISSMGYNVDGDHYVKNIKQERRKILDTILATETTPEKIRCLFRVGNPINELLNVIVDEEIDVVVMGPKGRTDLETVLIGSVAEKVFRRSPATVISYRNDKVAARLRKRIKHK